MGCALYAVIKYPSEIMKTYSADHKMPSRLTIRFLRVLEVGMVITVFLPGLVILCII